MVVQQKISIKFQRAVAPLRRRLFSSDRGSASVEFSLLAIPLFIPLFIYLIIFHYILALILLIVRRILIF